MEIDSDKIYIKTFRKENKKEGYLIFSLKGDLLKKVYLEPLVKTGVMTTMLGVKLSSIHKGKVFYLKENFDTETWELFNAKLL